MSNLTLTIEDMIKPSTFKQPKVIHKMRKPFDNTPTINPKVIDFLQKATDTMPEDLPEYDGKTIPRIIHFCYINYKNIPAGHDVLFLAWMEHLKDYTFINWTPEKLHSNPFIKFALENKRWAFFADYVRVYAVGKYGGFYMDCDVMVYKSFNDLLTLPYVFDAERRYVDGRAPEKLIECGSFGAQPGNPLIMAIEKYYASLNSGFKLGPDFVAPRLWNNVAKRNHIDINQDFSKKLKGIPTNSSGDYYNDTLNIDVYKDTVTGNPDVIYLLDSTYLSKPNCDMYTRYCVQHPHDASGVFPWAYTSHQFYTEWSLSKPSKDA